MGEIAITLTKWTIRIGFMITMIFALVLLVNFSLSLVVVDLNQNVLQDLFSLIQIWLPFDLNVMLLWLVSAVGVYFTYRMSVIAFNSLNRLIGDS